MPWRRRSDFYADDQKPQYARVVKSMPIGWCDEDRASIRRPNSGRAGVFFKEVPSHTKNTVGDNRKPDMQEAGKSISGMPYPPLGLCGWSGNYHRRSD
jgi:hypothetical protein